MDVLADFTSSIHLHCLALELRQFQLYRAGGIGGRDLKLQLKLITNQVMSVMADTLPLGCLFIDGLDFKPIIILFFVHLDVSDDGLEFLFKPGLPLCFI